MNFFGVEQDLLADVTVEAVARKQIDRTAKDLGQFITHLLQRHQADPRIGGEIDQHINIAVRIEIIPNGGAENGKLAHGMGATEIAYCSMRNGHLRIHLKHRVSWLVCGCVGSGPAFCPTRGERQDLTHGTA